MFTIDQIKTAHARVKSGADFPQYVRDLKALGVISYDNHVGDGRTFYHGVNNYAIEGPAKYPTMPVARMADKAKLETAIKNHQAGNSDYITVCGEAAEAGVDKWTVHVSKLTCTYYDKEGSIILVEDIPE